MNRIACDQLDMVPPCIFSQFWVIKFGWELSGLVWFGVDEFGLIWLSLVECGSVWYVRPWFCLVLFSLVWCDQFLFGLEDDIIFETFP